ncbi:M48 family metalloprotease [Bdellovibrio sp. HCB2-146]|uniref:M48 family metalloprotease n=1 Tax=Bdellovibrio sp. HCB2-146 TaxID=3394362 RepID=UPI0039BCC7DC
MKTLLFVLSLIFVSTAWAQRVLPMIPVYKESTFSKKFLGVKIPYEAIKGQDDLLLAHTQLRSLGLTTYPALDGILNFTSGTLERGAGGVLGTVKQYTNLVYSSGTTIGLTINWGSGDSNTLVVGKDITYGLKMDFAGLSSNDLREKGGFWIPDPLSKILQEGTSLATSDSARDIALQTARYGNFRLKALNRDANSLDWPRAKFQVLAETPRSNFVLRTSENPVPVTMSRRLEKTIVDTRKNGADEQIWIQTLRPINDLAPVWKEPLSQKIVQSLCDLLARSHGVPVALSAQCSVFASLTPNAFAYPGGDIFVTAGLLGVIPNVDTLAFFLAHEYSHVIARHTSKKMKREDMMASFYTTMSILSSVATWGSAGDIAELTRNLGVQSISMESLKLSTEALLTSHTRSDEEEADLLGLEMAMNIGADPRKIVEGLRALQSYCDDTFKRQQRGVINQFMTADHKELEQRIRTITEEAADIHPTRTSAGERFREISVNYEKLFKSVSPLSNYYHLQLRSQR